MMQMDTKFDFGKYSGEYVKNVLIEEPEYLCWLLRSGFTRLGKEPTLAVHAWEEANPKQVLKIQHSIDRKKAEDAVSEGLTKLGKMIDGGRLIVDDPNVTSPHEATRRSRLDLEAQRAANPAWGTW